MTIEEELRARIEILRTKVWVDHPPTKQNEVCAVFDAVRENEYSSRFGVVVSCSVKAMNLLDEIAKEIGYQTIVDFNDSQMTVDPVIEIFEKAAARAGELGL